MKDEDKRRHVLDGERMERKGKKRRKERKRKKEKKEEEVVREEGSFGRWRKTWRVNGWRRRGGG